MPNPRLAQHIEQLQDNPKGCQVPGVPTTVFGCIVSEQGMLIQTSALHLDLPLIPDMLKGENKFILAKQEVKFLITIVREKITKEKIKHGS